MATIILMEIKNNNEAKTEKKTKDLGTFVLLNQKSILNYVEEILDKFENDPGYKEKILKQILPDRKYKNTKKSQDYKLISRILKDEMGIQDAGETTIWRLLKIKEDSPDLYNQIKENRISIRTAFSKLIGEENRKAKTETDAERHKLIKRGKLDFSRLIEELDYIEAELDKIAKDERKQPSLRKMKQADEKLFRIRKKLGSMITDNDPEKFI